MCVYDVCVGGVVGAVRLVEGAGALSDVKGKR